MGKRRYSAALMFVATAFLANACSDGAAPIESYQTDDVAATDGIIDGPDSGSGDVATFVDIGDTQTPASDTGGVQEEVKGAEDTEDACDYIGCPCQTDDDCESWVCEPGRDGLVCTGACTDKCFGNAYCALIEINGDLFHTCLQRSPVLCRPCLEDIYCNLDSVDLGALCLPTTDPTGSRFCGSSCDSSKPCPPGFQCSSVTLPDGHTSTQCVPTSGSCD